jgi:hypothetical protein
LGVALPQSIHAFYSEVETCVLALRNLIWIKSPSEVVGFERMHRAFEVEGGEQIQPVRLIRFAESLIDGICFAFRKGTTDDAWRIVTTWNEETTEYFQGAEFNGHGDPSIDEWMKRLMNTDGHPIFDDREPWLRRIK